MLDDAAGLRVLCDVPDPWFAATAGTAMVSSRC
jgi:hypothetical protein